MICSLRYVEPVSSFRTTFAYTNVTHLIAGRVVAKTEGVADWNVVLREELLDPLGMKQSSYTAEAIKAAPNHAEGYRYAPDGSAKCLSIHCFPTISGGAGDINSNIEPGPLPDIVVEVKAIEQGSGAPRAQHGVAARRHQGRDPAILSPPEKVFG
jgi:CubicO group peptidase (beta-lactamase class C family)